MTKKTLKEVIRNNMIIKDIDDLYSKLIEFWGGKSLTKVSNIKIVISPYSELKMEISQKNYFDIYINGVFYYSIEPEEVFEFIKDFFNGKYIFVEKTDRDGDKSVSCVDASKASTFYNIENIKIYSSEKILY